jgi:hypothetical protein
MLKSTPSRLDRQTDSGGMIRKPCGWEAMIWHPPANVRPQLRLDQSPIAQGVSQPTLEPCFFRDTPTGASTKKHLTGPHYFLLPNRKQPNITPENVRRTCHVTCTRKQNYGQVHISMCSYQLVHVCRSLQITYMYLGFSSPTSAISSSVFPAIFQSSLPALLPRFLLTKYNDMDA